MDFSYSGYFLLTISYWLFFSTYSFSGNSVSSEQRAYAEEYLHNKSAKGFMENKGQMTDDKNNPVPNVLFKSELPGIDLYLTTSGFTYVFLNNTKEEKRTEKEPEDSPLSFGEGRGEVENIKTDYARVDVILRGAAIKKENIITEYPSEEDYRYYLGHCPQGITGVKKYKKITIKEVYPGIDWVWYINKNGVVKYDFEVHAHANPGQIQMQYKWADIKTMNNGESLHIITPIGELTEGGAVSYNNGKTIPTHYELNDKTVSFKTEQYNPNETLTIDPPLQLVWSSLYGGNNQGIGYGITCDNTGNIFATGFTTSINFPTNAVTGAYFQGTNMGNMDCFILKFISSGVLIWATYYGGNSEDRGRSICTDAAGNVFVTGFSKSTDLPTLDPGAGVYFQMVLADIGYGDCFILKFDNGGARKWATYYGGDDYDYGYSITADATGNIFVTGAASSTNFPALNPGLPAYFQVANASGFDCFILKFDNSGIRQWATYYGGNSSDVGNSICTDATGNVFVTGYTSSADFPTFNPGLPAYFQGFGGYYDCFILKFTNNGAILWTIFYGGIDSDQGYSICTDATGNVFVTGITYSSNFPTLDPGGGAYFLGAISGGGSRDCFILKFSNSGVRSWATYYGGNAVDEGYSITTDRVGNVFVGGLTTSANFPILDLGSGAYFQGTYGGVSDLFFSMFTNSGIEKWSTYYGGIGNDDVIALAVNPINCDLYFAGDGGSFQYTATTYTTFPSVDPGGGTWFQNQPGLINTDYPILGRFTGMTINCQLPLSVSVTATNIICNGDSTGSATANVSGGTSPFTYQWNPNGKTTQTISGITVGTYTVIVTDALMATATATVTIVSLNTITAMVSGDTTIQNGQSTTLSASGGLYYQWNPATGLNCTSCPNPTASPIATTIYCVTVTDINGCIDSACVTVNVESNCEELFIPTAFSPNGDNNNDCFGIYGTGNCFKNFYLAIYDRWGEKVFTTNDPAECWDGAPAAVITGKNKKLNTGIFVYYLNAITVKNEEIIKRGNISLIR